MLDDDALDRATALLEALARDGHPTAGDALARLTDEPPEHPKLRRDRLIVECWRQHYFNMSQNKAADEMAAMIERYEATSWRFHKSSALVPDALKGKPQEFAFELLRTGERLSKATIRKALTG